MKIFVESVQISGGRVDQENVCCVSVLNEEYETFSFIFHHVTAAGLVDEVKASLEKVDTLSPDLARRTRLEQLSSSIMLDANSLAIAVDHFDIWARASGFVLVITGAGKLFDLEFDAAAAHRIHEQLGETFSHHLAQRYLH